MVYLPFKLLLKKKPKTEENENKIVGVRTPFGPMLAAGALVYLLFLETEVDKYFELVAELLT